MSDRLQWCALGLIFALVAGSIAGLFTVLKAPPEKAAQVVPDKPAPPVQGESHKARKAATSTETAPELVIIFRHEVGRSMAKLIRDGAPIPQGWQDGRQMRVVNARTAERENTLAAMLADGKEGDTAEIR